MISSIAGIYLAPERAKISIQVRQMRVGLLLIALQFIIPAISYVVDPSATVAVVWKLNALLGGASSWPEDGHLWHMLAVGNVMTLGFLCLLIRSDVERFLPALPALAFLKGFSALYSLGLATHTPVFILVFLLDGATTVAMVVLALRAAWSLAKDQSAPWWSRWLLLDPARIEARLALVAARRPQDAPNLAQALLGARRMWHRILFRSDTIGTSSTNAVRDNWRARLLNVRALRLPALVAERAIAPLDPTGLISSPARIRKHLLTAHHDGAQFFYDLELLSLYPGELELLRVEAQAIVDGSHPRARWLRDLCVFERYHEQLLAALARMPLIDPAALDDPDLTLTGFLRWCRSQDVGHAPSAASAALTSPSG